MQFTYKQFWLKTVCRSYPHKSIRMKLQIKIPLLKCSIKSFLLESISSAMMNEAWILEKGGIPLSMLIVFENRELLLNRLDIWLLQIWQELQVLLISPLHIQGIFLWHVASGLLKSHAAHVASLMIAGGWNHSQRHHFLSKWLQMGFFLIWL